MVAPLFLHLVLAAEKYIEDADRFPGWKGELPHIKHGQPGEPDSVELAFGEHGKVISTPNILFASLFAEIFVVPTALSTLSASDPAYLKLQDKWTGEVVELSWQPRAFLFKKFMTDEECDHIIAKVLFL